MKLTRVIGDEIAQRPFESFFIESWEGWDELDIFANQFYDAKLAIDLGPYKKGDVLAFVALDLQRSIIEIPDPENEDECLTYSIEVTSLEVVEKNI